LCVREKGVIQKKKKGKKRGGFPGEEKRKGVAAAGGRSGAQTSPKRNKGVSEGKGKGGDADLAKGIKAIHEKNTCRPLEAEEEGEQMTRLGVPSSPRIRRRSTARRSITCEKEEVLPTVWGGGGRLPTKKEGPSTRTSVAKRKKKRRKEESRLNSKRKEKERHFHFRTEERDQKETSRRRKREVIVLPLRRVLRASCGEKGGKKGRGPAG